MKVLQITISLGIIGLLIVINANGTADDIPRYGGLTWFGWLGLLLIGGGGSLLVFISDSARALGIFRRRGNDVVRPSQIRTLDNAELRELGLEKYRGPAYPHPVIFPERCIGCQACVDACPHDVLAIVDGTAAAVAPDLCMEDTACQAECPVNPKACIVINTAKEVRSMPTPTRDGSTYETNVPGCFIIGDVSGVPLIKNAVKEGGEVIGYIASEIAGQQPEQKAEYDVAIIGIGPGGASAAVTAVEKGLRYVAIEQDKVLSTIQLYPKGKYIFFKPDAKDWAGGIPVAGLGLSKPKYSTDDSGDTGEFRTAIGPEATSYLDQAAAVIAGDIQSGIPPSLRLKSGGALVTKVESELAKRVKHYLRSKGQGDWSNLYKTYFTPNAVRLLNEFREDIASQLKSRIPGDQRENILEVWLTSLDDRGVRVNDNESCKAIEKAVDGDYFIVRTERGADKELHTYNARRVVLAIGLRGAPNRLRLPNEEMRITLDGLEQQKVVYGLSNPMDFRGRDIIVVGGGNVAVEAAVDLVAVRDGASISPRRSEDMNRVTVLVRDYLAPTVKFANKFQLYTCAENGLLDLRFGVGIREMREHEVILENVTTKQEIGTIKNDLVFALIGGERPNRFLESIGITIK